MSYRWILSRFIFEVKVEMKLPWKSVTFTLFNMIVFPERPIIKKFPCYILTSLNLESLISSSDELISIISSISILSINNFWK